MLSQFYYLLTFETDYFFSAVCIVLWLLLLFSAPIFLRQRRGKWIFWPGIVGSGVLAILLSLALGVVKTPHGLSATYYGNASWQPSDMKLERYFADGKGGRIDRFIDFHQNDFNIEYRFSRRPFSVIWEGSIFVPFESAYLAVRSNFDTWFSVDGRSPTMQIAAPTSLDIGTADARPYLRKNQWSFDEHRNTNPPMNFVWAIDDDPEILIGIPEVADYELLIRCRSFHAPGKPAQHIQVMLEKEVIGSVALREGWHVYAFPLPATLIEKVGIGSQRLIFEFSELIRVSDVNPDSRDRRTVAAAFDTIELRRLNSASPQTETTIMLERGLHTIQLRARSMVPDPFIQLVWQDDSSKTPRIIRSDDLFPKTSPEAIVSTYSQERVLLTITIFYKTVLTIWWIGLGVGFLARPFITFVWRKEAVVMLAIGLLAFAIRFVFLLEMRTLDPDFYFPTPGSDHATYAFMARGFFRGYWPNLTHQPFYFSPLIAFYMIAVSMMSGEHLIAVRIITALLGSIGVIFVYLIAKKTLNQATAYLAAIFCVCNSVLIFYDISLLSDPLVTVLNLLTLWLMLKWNDHLSFRITVMLGMTLGLTALSRGTIALLMPLFFFWTLKTGAGSIRRKISHFTLLCVVTAFVILPVTIRNYFADERHFFVPTNTAGGIVLWANLNPSSNGMGGYDPQALQEARNRMRTEGTTFGDEVQRFIVEQPADFLRLEFHKLKLFLRGYEVCDNWSYYIFRHVSKILRLPWLNFVIIAPLGLVGMLSAYRRWNALLLLYGFVFVQLLSALIFNAASRYRLPVVPVLSVFAAYGVWEISARIRQKRWATAVVLISLFVVMYLAFNYPDAARYYERNQGHPMPFSRVLRYWDLFYTW
ncbi:tetratricopeptide TPR_2 repeat protein [Candidatus Vecturithrix granuli]|uniref:Tetratricopeptide TPR_2 repeat protein n=1 Tax=Vecturithrix granuli TaxID=1499967 RepID=A0A081BZY2_VECG1|nr:tetratricopeptide TPR_2 repeat protein [Candidatus Vecturithrix granuli]